MECTVLLDSPGEPAKQIQIARLGPVKDRRYGDFEITAENVENWKRNLSALPGQRALIDFEHRSEKAPRNSEAAGWITAINLDGNKVMADAEWSDKGEDAIRNKRYLFLSPAYGAYRNEHGETFDDTLVSTALTNKPVLGSLPMLTLASEERVSEALDQDPAARFHLRALDGEYGDITRALVMLDVSAGERKLALKEGNSLPDGSYPIRNTAQLQSAAILAASGHGDAAGAKKLIKRRAKELGIDVKSLPGFTDESADSRRTMDKELLTLLDLPEDADEPKVLEAVAALKTQADEKPEVETKTLEQQAAENGKILLDSAKFAELASNAAAGKAASDELRAQRFETSFTRALEHGRALPAQKEQMQKFYLLDAEGTLAMLDDGPQLVNVSPAGQSYSLDGSDIPEDKKLDQEVKRRLKEQKLSMSDYPRILDEILNEDGEL